MSPLPVTIAATAQALSKSIVDTFITPKLQQLDKYIKVSFKGYTHDYWQHQFADYVVNYYGKYSVINTIAFNNQQRLLKDLYIPLTVVRKDNNEPEIIDEYTDSFLPYYRNVIITDTAGMGKSTLTKRLFLSIVEANKGIPVIIELRRLSKEKKIIDEIVEQLSPLKEEADRDLVLKLIDRGDFIFFFDGYDEIGLEDKGSVTTDMQGFIDKAKNNIFVITSRPEEALVSFGDFMNFSIKPLEPSEAFELLRKYNNYGELSTLLIDKINDVFSSVKEFLANPLLVSLLYTAFEYKQTIPFKKHVFYRQVYDALFESHDLSKGDSFERSKIRRCVKLDREDFHRILRFIAFECMKYNKTEFIKDEIIQLFDKAKSFCADLSFKSADLLLDITKSAPLFSVDGPYYKWSHKSLQEYFAAQFIHLDSKEEQKNILDKLANSHRNYLYLNILDLYASIDPKTFRAVVLKRYLEKFVNLYEYLYEKFDISEDEAEVRAGQMYFYEYFLVLGPVLTEEVIGDQKKMNAMYHLTDEYEEILKDKALTMHHYPKVEENDDKQIHVIMTTKKEWTLVRLLLGKGDNRLFRILPQSHNEGLKIENVDYMKEYHLNSSPDNVLNSSANFNNMTGVIRFLSNRIYNTVLDLSEVRKYLVQLNIESDLDQDMLLGNF